MPIVQKKSEIELDEETKRSIERDLRNLTDYQKKMYKKAVKLNNKADKLFKIAFELNEEEITSYSSYSLFLDRLRLLKMEMENQHLEDNNSFLNELCNLECNSSYLDFTFKKGKYEE